MKRKLLFVCTMLLALCLAAGGVSAFAAVREDTISDAVLTESGAINILDWEQVGEKTAFTPVVTNRYAASGASTTTVVYYGELLNLADGTVVLEYECNGATPANWFSPFISDEYGQPQNKIDFQNYANSYSVSAASLHVTQDPENGWAAWQNEACTENYGRDYNFTGKAEGTKLIVHYALKADGTLGVITYNENTEGNRTVQFEMWLSKKIAAALRNKDVYIGVQFGGGCAADNLKITQDGKTIADVDFDDNTKLCSKTDLEDEKTDTAGKVNVEGTVGGESFITMETSSNADRLVSSLPVKGDNLENAFTMEGKLRFTELGKKFGIATGLADFDSALDSVIWLYNESDTTRIGSTKTGEAVDLEVNLAGGTEFVPFTISGKSNGTVTVTMAEKTATFTGFTVKGLVGFVTEGEGKVEVDIDRALSVKTYVYRGSEKDGQANNFNTGYINPKNWKSLSNKAALIQNAVDAKGLLVEDGKVKFEGTADGAYFATTHRYADYILEFDYITPEASTRPGTNAPGYGALAVGIGSNSEAGFINSCMIMMQETYVQLQNYKSGTMTQIERGKELPSFYTDGGTFAFKFVVMNGNIKVYMQEITEQAFDAQNYDLVGDFTVPDAYGYVSFTSTESSFFAIDNVRITDISNSSVATMEATIGAYVDRAPIADEAAPIPLAAPVVTLTDTTVSWEAVEHATGYVVTVNGKPGEKQTTTQYTVTAEAGKSYEITVIAVGDDDKYTDSAASNKVTYTAPGANQGNNQGGTGTQEPAKKGCGCKSQAATAGCAAAAVVVLAAAAVLCARKKKENR